MKLTVPEILQLVSDAPNHQAKVDMLRKHNSAIIEQLLQYNYGDWITFTLPEGAPPYKRDESCPVAMSPSNLTIEGRRLYIFLNGYGENISMTKKEMLFINILEGIHPTEADVLLAVKDKTLEKMYPGLSYELVQEAIKELLPPLSTLTVKPVVVFTEMPVEAVMDTFKEDTVDREAPLVVSDIVPKDSPKKVVDRSAMVNYIVMENGERIRIKSDGTPWLKKNQKVKE